MTGADSKEVANASKLSNCNSLMGFPSFTNTFNDLNEIHGRAQACIGQAGQAVKAMVTHIARNLEVEASLIGRQVNQERERGPVMRPNQPIRSDATTEVERLKRKLRRITMERDIFKEAIGYFAKDPH